jgi:hypothetical protein
MESVKSFILAAVVGLVLAFPLEVDAQGFCTYGSGGVGSSCGQAYCVGHCGCLQFENYTWCSDEGTTCYSLFTDEYDGEGCQYVCNSTLYWYCYGI